MHLLFAPLLSALALAVAPPGPQESSPRPATNGAATPEPVQVYVLLGQSNMLGFGRPGPAETPGTLAALAGSKPAARAWVDDEGAWVVRDDVRSVHVMDERGADFRDLERFGVVKNEWLTVSGRFGPELGLGRVLGDHHEAPVLLLKACIGNRSLGWDLLPPGSERFEYEGRTYAGYGDEDSSWGEDDPYESKDERGWYAGRQYDADTTHAKAVLADLAAYLPGYEGQGYELAGFVFWQGHKDQNAAHASRYRANLVRFIDALRRDFEAPEADFVLATIAFGGTDLAGHGLTVCEAQLAVDGRRGNVPRFADNVRTVDARPFWRAAAESPVDQGYHYNHNAGTYLDVGEALGRALVELKTD